MQAVMDRHEAKASAAPQEQGNASVLHFPLEGIAPAGCFLFLNTTLKTFSVIARGPHSPLLLKERQFTAAELSLLRPLLESFPHYCPYEVMFASFYNGTISDDVVAVSRKQLQQALDEGTWNQEMSPLRNVLSRVRLKLRDMGINPVSILETGYVLDKCRPPRRPRTQDSRRGGCTSRGLRRQA